LNLIHPQALGKAKAGAVIVGVEPAGGQPGGPGIALAGGDGLPADLLAALAQLLPALGATGEAGQVTRVPASGAIAAPVIAAVGLGQPADDAAWQAPDPAASPGRAPRSTAAGPSPAALERLRRAAGAATRSLAGTDSVVLALPAATPAEAGAVAEGALLGAYAFTRYRDRPAPPAAIAVATAALSGKSGKPSKALKAAAARAEAVAQAVAAARDLVNAAPNDLYPETFAAEARSAAKGVGAKVTVLGPDQLKAGGYGGILAVGQGSARPPRLVKVVWAPARAKHHVALVGKGITFDSGGLSIKPASSMETMKSDMAGAAAVLQTVVAAARLALPIRVTGWLAVAENMPSGRAQRPSDVITIRGGKTVEVLNTDAEGRLVLADALVAAGEDSPDVIVDIATLTGAQVVALGPRVGGVMGSDAVRAEVIAAAQRAGESFWPMPLPAELRKSLDSQMADLANIGGRWGGMLTAGIFLREFTGGAPWAHLDIAGPAFNAGEAHGYTPAGGTGCGVRTLIAFLEARA
jgi:leucyl aminopeptidase